MDIKYFSILSVLLGLFGCASNDYIPPLDGPTATISHKLHSVVSPSEADGYVRGNVFVFEGVDCANPRFVGSIEQGQSQQFVVSTSAPITLMSSVFVNTNDYKMTTYMSRNVFSFNLEDGGNYNLTSSYTFSPLMSNGEFVIPFAVSSKVTRVGSDIVTPVVERNKKLISPYDCEKEFVSFLESDYVNETEAKSGL